MLKVLINEEEVLTNKDFTIKKEMLNTPSVILNNVYPKTWEDTKDYTSNFYHPQDYSKCKIIDETIIPAEPGETISGTSFTIANNDNTKINELTEIEGNTTQSGTPTPSSPQPINVVSGRQEVKVVGKNLFNKDNIVYGKSWNDGTDTKRARGDITNRPNQDITISVKNISNLDFVRIVLTNDNFSANNVAHSFTSNGSYTLTPSYSPQLTRYEIEIQKTNISSTDLENVEIQIEYGNQATTYETYKGQSYEINLGKNLINLTDGTYDNNGVTAVVNNGEITLNGTATTSTSFITIPLLTEIYLGNANKTLSLNNSQIISDTLTECRLYTSGQDYNSVNFSTTNGTRTFSNDRVYTRLQIRSSVGVSYNNFVFKPQLEKGSTSTNWVQYKTPIELCKINTYKDRIYKDSGKWYLEKNIGKYVLTGSENWNVQATDTNFTTFQRADILTDEAKANNFQQGLCLSNHFKTAINWNIWTNTDVGIDAYVKRVILTTPSSIATTKATLNQWLQANKVELYYVLATPTTTEITDTELISQLNSIELLEGLNNVSVSSAYLPGEITIHYNYTEEQTIDDLLFCGVVKNSGNISLNPREPHYSSLQILDFKTFLSEGELDSFVIYQKTITEAIQMVIANIQDYGFILGNVNILNPTDIIGAYSTKDKTAYDVFNYLADITQSRWTTRLIDENHVAIDFYDPTLMIEGTPINYTQTFFEDNLIDDMTYSYGSNNYRNKQVMTSSQVYSNISQQQSIVANGYQTQFPTEQPIGKINSITSNGIPLTFATFNEKDMGYVADFYYSPRDNYFESEDLRSTGEILIIDYVAIVEGRQIITNPLEIDRINESTGRKGIISRYEQRNDATTSTELQKIGESYIKYKGTPEIKLKIKTRSNIWEVGQRVQFNAPIEELDTEYMVRTKKINYISTIDTIFYEYELISSFNSETEINYFDNQRAKASGNIGEGEYISRNIDIESTANIIFYDTETTEVQVDGDNELNAILNSPFTS